ncbi:MAG: hypothetical protein HQL20_11335 [Candidatus Omnitrophica bacterium]|nr:hypothetical protein [Candidatus Omnitrophota bacterium]
MENQCLSKKFFHMAHSILENHSELELSEANIREVKDLMNNSKKSFIKSTAEIETIAVDLMAEMWDVSPDSDKIYKLLDKKYTLKKESVKALMGAFLSLKKMLSKEQLCKLYGFCKAHAHAEKKDGSCKR